MNIKQACEDAGVARATVYRRLASGLNVEDALKAAKHRKSRPRRQRPLDNERLLISHLLQLWR